MAGIGFQLKRLFERDGLLGRSQAIAYASLVTVGPMICCMLAMTAVHWILVAEQSSYYSRVLFQAGMSYAFAASFIVAAPFSMVLTRAVSDHLYAKRYAALLPLFYNCLRTTLAAAAVPGIVFAVFAGVSLEMKATVIMVYMVLTVIWIEVVYISAMKAYRRIAAAFLTGMAAAVTGVFALARWNEALTAPELVAVLGAGFGLTACMLLVQIDRFFRLPDPAEPSRFTAAIREYPSLAAIGLCTGLCMFGHQFGQWVWNGEWLEHSFRLAPDYDVAVYFAVLSILPTLVGFVVSVETAFYPKFRSYYDAILGKGTIVDIERAKDEMQRVLMGELAKLMGMQLVYSIVSVACGIRFLPYIGFTASQIDTYNVLVMSYYAYAMVNVLLLLLLYFDDRRGALAVAGLFLAANVTASWILHERQYEGLSLFAASFPVLIVSLGRLIHRLRNIHYVTFSAQPLVVRKRAEIG